MQQYSLQPYDSYFEKKSLQSNKKHTESIKQEEKQKRQKEKLETATCMHIIRVAPQADTCALISTCLPACRCGETRETTTWTLPSLCSETLRLDSWVRRLLLWLPNREIHRTLLLQFIHETFLLVGEALLESNTVIDFVYCSPSLRCVQTAQNILKGESRWSSLTFTWILSPFF